MYNNLQVLTIVSVLTILQAAQLPTYLTPCKRSDPKLLECFKRNGNKGIRDIAKGDYHYDIPSAIPLRIPGPVRSRDNNQEIIVTNLEIHGLEQSTVSDVELDIENGIYKLVLEVPSITAFANCQSTGNYFGYAVSNHELLNEKLDGTTITYGTNFTVREVDDDRYFTRLTHSAELQAKQQYSGFFRNFGNVQAQRTICQERFPQIIQKQIGEYIFSILRALAVRVPVKDVFLQ